MKYLYIILSMILIISSIACSKTNDSPQSFNPATQTYVYPSIKIDTIFNYTLNFPSNNGNEKSFDLPMLDGINDPEISVYYRRKGSIPWIKLPWGFEAFYNRYGRKITVYFIVGFGTPTEEISVRIIAVW